MKEENNVERICGHFFSSISSASKIWLLIEKELMLASIAWIDSRLEKISEREKRKKAKARRSKERFKREAKTVEVEETPEEPSETPKE